MSNETDDKVDEALATWNVKFTTFHRGLGNRDGWKCDDWLVSFLAPGNPHRVDFDYHTGMGHRKLDKASEMSLKRIYGKRVPRSEIDKASKPVAPRAASVLYGLILDARANDMSFLNWCAEYGYDTDSIKALNTYNTCCQTDLKLRSIFNRDQIKTLDVFLEDY